jgi:hypothetical protein
VLSLSARLEVDIQTRNQELALYNLQFGCLAAFGIQGSETGAKATRYSAGLREPAHNSEVSRSVFLRIGSPHPRPLHPAPCPRYLLLFPSEKTEAAGDKRNSDQGRR